MSKQIITALLIGLAGAVGFSPLLAAEAGKPHGPSTNVYWDAQTVKFANSGDARRGGNLNTELMCASCHGNDGVGTSANWPSIAGQRAEYTFKMLKDYQDGKRNNGDSSAIMVSVASVLSDQDMADLAAFYAALPLPAGRALPSQAGISAEMAAQAEQLVLRGDGERLLAPCAACHEARGRGQEQDIPALVGQMPDYFVRTMLDYRDGSRSSDLYARMRHISKVLTDEEINALAAYYANLK